MILYFLLLPDILSALTISVDIPHGPCRAAHPARHSSPGSQSPTAPGTSETPGVQGPGEAGAHREPPRPGHGPNRGAAAPGAALTGDEPHGPDPRPHEEAEPAAGRGAGGSGALPRRARARQGPLGAGTARPGPGHSLVAGAGGRPGLHLVQLVHVVLLRGQGAGWGGRGRRAARPGRSPGTFRMETLAMRSRGLIRSASMNRSFFPGSCRQAGMGGHPAAAPDYPPPGPRRYRPRRLPTPAPVRDPGPACPRTCSSR